MFPSPIGVIFSLIRRVSVPDGNFEELSFPSPIRVIFSLMLNRVLASGNTESAKFPSPIGVIFSLIGEIRIHKTNTKINIVSVSYRSYILSYLMEDLYFKSEEAKMFPSPIGVIFSLISGLVLFMRFKVL